MLVLLQQAAVAASWLAMVPRTDFDLQHGTGCRTHLRDSLALLQKCCGAKVAVRPPVLAPTGLLKLTQGRCSQTQDAEFLAPSM